MSANPNAHDRDQRIDCMNALPFVRWDRAAGDTIFGWIARDDDPADFVVLTFENDKVIGYTTSSAARTEEIGRLLYGDDGSQHYPCQRVADVYGDAVRNQVGGPR